MPRIRTIKPDYWEDEKIASLPRDARLLFIGLWNFADDKGRMRANPRFVQSKVFPYDTDLDVADLLHVLAGSGRILLYEVDGQQYLWIRHFLNHQKIDRAQESSLPAPPDEPSRVFDDDSMNDRRTIAPEWNGMECNGRDESPAPAREAPPRSARDILMDGPDSAEVEGIVLQLEAVAGHGFLNKHRKRMYCVVADALEGRYAPDCIVSSFRTWFAKQKGSLNPDWFAEALPRLVAAANDNGLTPTGSTAPPREYAHAPEGWSLRTAVQTQ